MFGNNPVRQKTDSPYLSVVEVFPTIQGEGPLAGLSTIFVRLAGCNLRCTFCDTAFDVDSVDDWRGRAAPPEEELGRVVAWIQSAQANVPNAKYVVLTGGEPLRQPLKPLIEAINKLGLKVQIETAGTLWQDDLAPLFPDRPWRYLVANQIVISPKTPRVNPEIAKRAAAWKYLIGASYDEDKPNSKGLPTRVHQPGASASAKLAMPRIHGLERSRIYVQPIDYSDDVLKGTQAQRERLNTQALRRAITAVRRYGYRMSLQQHKLLGLP